ncbi:transposase, partial [uncultured Comamonas sp.]|uniref:transposase n=1 Tax=uncultured Comamonas sp. TaxID=114710 RepID=UPI00338E7911
MLQSAVRTCSKSLRRCEKSRDPEMHQTKKGNQWYFGMKAHIGVDADSGLVHTVR